MLCTILWKMFSEMGVEASNGIKGTFWRILRRNDGEGGFLSSSLRKTLMCVPLLCYLIDTHTQRSYHLNSVKSMWTSRELGGFSLFISQPPLLWRLGIPSSTSDARERKRDNERLFISIENKRIRFSPFSNGSLSTSSHLPELLFPPSFYIRRISELFFIYFSQILDIWNAERQKKKKGTCCLTGCPASRWCEPSEIETRPMTPLREKLKK